jgi:hypothetical protein
LLDIHFCSIPEFLRSCQSQGPSAPFPFCVGATLQGLVVPLASSFASPDIALEQQYLRCQHSLYFLLTFITSTFFGFLTQKTFEMGENANGSSGPRLVVLSMREMEEALAYCAALTGTSSTSSRNSKARLRQLSTSVRLHNSNAASQRSRGAAVCRQGHLQNPEPESAEHGR